MTWQTHVGFIVFILLSSSANAIAQGRASQFDQLHTQGLLKPGDPVIVTDSAGRRTRARILDLSPASLTFIQDGKTRTLAHNEVRKVERRDSVENGIYLGLATGIAASVAACKADSHPCYRAAVNPMSWTRRAPRSRR
jgi:hypothetical protein